MNSPMRLPPLFDDDESRPLQTEVQQLKSTERIRQQEISAEVAQAKIEAMAGPWYESAGQWPAPPPDLSEPAPPLNADGSSPEWDLE